MARWKQVSTLNAPDETLPLEPGSLDLVLSLLTLHEANDVPGALIQMKRALKPDGLMLAVMPGGETLKELRFALTQAETEIYGGASPRVLPFADVRAAGALLQRTGFALPVTDVETLTVRYDNVFALMADLRGMGAQNALHARSRRPVSRRFFQRAGGDLRGEFQRCGRAGAGDVPVRLAVRLGAACIAAEAAEARIGQSFAGGFSRQSLNWLVSFAVFCHFKVSRKLMSDIFNLVISF